MSLRLAFVFCSMFFSYSVFSDSSYQLSLSKECFAVYEHLVAIYPNQSSLRCSNNIAKAYTEAYEAAHEFEKNERSKSAALQLNQAISHLKEARKYNCLPRKIILKAMKRLIAVKRAAESR